MLAKMKHYLNFHRDGLEGLKLIHQVDASAIPVSLLNALVRALYPYIQLFIGAYIIDELLAKDFDKVLILIGILIGAHFVGGLIQDVLGRVDEYKGSKILRLTSLEVRKKALAMDYETFEDAKTLEKLNSAIYSMQFQGGFGALLQNYCKLFEAIFSIVTSISLVIYLCFEGGLGTKGIMGVFTSTPVSLVMVLSFLGMMVGSHFTLSKYMNTKNLGMFQKKLKAERTIMYYVQQVMFDYEKGKVIRLYGMNDMINKRFTASNHFARDVYKDHFPLLYFEQGVQSFTATIAILFSYLFVVMKVVVDAISIGDITKYVGAISQLNSGLTNLITHNNDIKLQCEYLKTFTDFMSLPNKRETGTIPIEKRLDNAYEIAFHNVSFAYPGTEEHILKNISCKIKMKDKLAVVGPNGAGKTTFIKLITRLYDPTEGHITLNGIDIRKYDYKEYLQLFGVVFQDFSLFAFPIEQNVAASVGINEQKIWDTLQLAGIDKRIEAMPMQIKTPLFKYDEGGVECSGGEKQKIAIARALYKDTPFVILDEPTAALDPISEYEIYSRFHELVKDKTSIYISHRMSSCRFCDEIIVFNEGHIIQRGSHDKLMQDEEALYATLWNAQASYYAS